MTIYSSRALEMILKFHQKKDYLNQSMLLVQGWGYLILLQIVPSYFLIIKRPKTSLDDSLDVVAAHGVGGLVGALLTGVFAQSMWGGETGLLFGNVSQFVDQIIGVVVTIIYSAVVTYLLLKLILLKQQKSL